MASNLYIDSSRPPPTSRRFDEGKLWWLLCALGILALLVLFWSKSDRDDSDKDSNDGDDCNAPIPPSPADDTCHFVPAPSDSSNYYDTSGTAAPSGTIPFAW